jgi:hypothetical protein
VSDLRGHDYRHGTIHKITGGFSQIFPPRCGRRKGKTKSKGQEAQRRRLIWTTADGFFENEATDLLDNKGSGFGKNRNEATD